MSVSPFAHRLLILLTLALTSCGKAPEPVATLPPPVVLPANCVWLSVKQTEDLIAKNKLLGILDARDTDEMRDGNGWINGAQTCPYLPGNETMLKSLDRNRPWLVYCTIGGRAELTAQTMVQLGFKEIYLLKGGFAEWRAQGKPVIK
jgi:rhodanese-related sulfurtransferase